MCVEGSIGCACKVWGQGTDCGGCGWKDVGMVATH